MHRETWISLFGKSWPRHCNKEMRRKTDAVCVPPAPKKIPHKLEFHGDVRTDDYFWLNERDNPEVLA